MRRRLLFGTILLTAATITALFVPAAVALANAEREAQLMELQQSAADASARLGRERDVREEREEHERSEPDDRAGTDADADADGGTNDFGLYDSDGRLVLGSGPTTADAPVLTALTGHSATATIGDSRIAAVPLSDGGAVRAAEPRAEADHRTREAVLRLALIAGLVLAAASTAAWLLAGRLIRPLGKLRSTAQRLGGGDFTAAAPMTGVVEIDEVAQALNTSAARIGSMVERERRLTADTSHQLRTPLAGLRLTLEAEKEAPRSDPSEVLDESLGAVERMEATVEALTGLARGEGTPAPLSLDDAVHEAFDRWRPHFEAVDRDLREEAETGATAMIRAAALDTILDVLLDNALGHGHGEVVLATGQDRDLTRIVIADEGECTVSEADLFSRHRSGDGGSGIGLHLARSLADAEGAVVRLVEPSPTTFEVVFASQRPSVERPPG